jgi:serine/threonine protein kinase
VNADAPRASGSVDPLVGRRVGHYEIERVLGAGGMGIVYLARDTKLGRTVALKSLPAEFAHDPRRRERLSHEARAAAALTHPGIATVYALEEIDDRLFIATEHVVGQTLREQLSGGPLSPADAMQIAADVARALAAAHRGGVIHRDLKPENVMRSDSGAVKILDFGLARQTGPALPPAGTMAATAAARTDPGTVLGTVGYMSPEQVRGEVADHRSDIFSLGAVLYEMLTGRPPFEGGTVLAILRKIGVETGGSNVQFAVDPQTGHADRRAAICRCPGSAGRVACRFGLNS